MAGADNCQLKREGRAEVLALWIYNRAGGEPVTRREVDEQMHVWQTHRPGCRCEAPCDLAGTVSVSRVWATLWGWQASIARTRRLAQH